MRNKTFYLKLAAGNLRRNRLLTLPHFLASSVMTAIYFMVMTIIYTRSIANVDYGAVLQSMMMIGVWIMSLLILIFMFYINSFLIKRRAKEFGLYGVLGLEKRHVARVVVWENLLSFVGSLAAGIGIGCLLGKLIFLALLAAMRVAAAGSEFIIPSEAFVKTAIMFSLVFVLCTLYNLIFVLRTNSLSLLKARKMGEKKLRFAWPIAIAGFALIGVAYYGAITVQNPLNALAGFFAAVFAVIAGTYLLFVTGSQLILRLLKKNKRFYYKPRNFIAVSSMMQRMKQNAAGLASICILSTMVLVTASTCGALYIGQEAILMKMFHNELRFQFITPGARDENGKITKSWLSESDVDEIEALASATAEEYGFDTSIASFDARSNSVSLSPDGTLSLSHGMENMDDISLCLVNADGYRAITGKEFPGGYAAIANFEADALDKLPVSSVEYREGLESYLNSYQLNTTPKVLFIACENSADIFAFYKETMNAEVNSSLQHVFIMEPKGDTETLIAFEKDLWDRLSNMNSERYGLSNFSGRSIERGNGFKMYGGLLFLGIFFTVLFLCATVLIIYFKQVSEGFDDRERFDILQKVGMDAREVKKTIDRQVALVFLLPLIGAFAHLAAAGNMIVKMLMLFALFDTGLTIACMAGACVLFALGYFVVFKLTARAYLSIVRR